MSMLVLPAIGVAALWLSYANGANDNFKGVATLFGSGTADYRRALFWGTTTTLAGSLFAVMLAGRLLRTFTGRGVVPDAWVGDPRFLLSAAIGAAGVVMIATVVGLPVSTTHALVGGLAGAGVSAAGIGGISWPTLAAAFAGPLLVSPVLSAGLVAVAYPAARRLRIRLGVRHDLCFCMTPKDAPELVPVGHGAVRLGGVELGRGGPRVGRAAACGLGYDGRVLGVTVQNLVDGAHYLSAGAVGFARGLNDTPKIAALLLAGGAIDASAAIVAVSLGMAAGATLQAYRVGHTMSRRITPMNSGQGFIANAATAVVVLFASRFALPVSTTHVSTAAIFGVGAHTGQLHAGLARTIVAAWIVTVPAAFAAAWLSHQLISGLALFV